MPRFLPSLGDGPPEQAGTCRFDLLGAARLAAGLRSVEVRIDGPTPVRSLLATLAACCPALAGSVLDVEAGALTAGYVLNRNGRDFLGADAVAYPGDILLVLSSAAGG